MVSCSQAIGSRLNREDVTFPKWLSSQSRCSLRALELWFVRSEACRSLHEGWKKLQRNSEKVCYIRYTNGYHGIDRAF